MRVKRQPAGEQKRPRNHLLITAYRLIQTTIYLTIKQKHIQ